MIARKHPIANWVRLPPAECRRTLDRVLQFRDSSDNPMASGMPEAAVTWFWTEELPRLLTRPDVRRQALERLIELQDNQLRLSDQIQMQAGALIEQQAAAQLEIQQLAALVEVTDG